MGTYTIQQLCEEGPQYAMAMLLRAMDAGEPFVTYGAIRSELEYQLKIPQIFSTQIGHVAGRLMDDIFTIDPNAPLINVMIARPNGIPGVGAGGYLAKRYGNPKLKKWDNISLKRKIDIIAAEHEKIFRYRKWAALNQELYGPSAGSKLRTPVVAEDYDPTGHHGGPAESEEHKRLKAWVANNPIGVGLAASFGQGKEEVRLLSGDEIDVMFTAGNSYRVVEVKSRRSNDVDFQRGIYQCVKYREVKKAEQAPLELDVEAVLVTERELNAELRARAQLLGIRLRVVSID